MKKKIEVFSTNARIFVSEIVRLAQLGATMPDNSPAFKGLILRAQLEVDEDVLVEGSPNIRIIPVSRKEREEKREKTVRKGRTTSAKEKGTPKKGPHDAKKGDTIGKKDTPKKEDNTEEKDSTGENISTG